MNHSDYLKGYGRVLKTAGALTMNYNDMHANSGVASGMAIGSLLGGKLAENLSLNSREKNFLGRPKPGTERMDPNTARLLGSVVGAFAGGSLGHLQGRYLDRLSTGPQLSDFGIY